VSTEDGFNPDHPLPLFLSDHAREPEERGLLLLLNAIILLMTVILIGIAIALSLGNPVAVFGDIKASLTDKSALQPQPVQSTSTIQSTADAQTLPSAARGGRDEVATAPDTADQSQGDPGEAPSDALFRQFQAWAAKQDARPQVERVRPTQDAQAPVPSIQTHQRVRPVQNARAEIRTLQHPQARVRRDQNPRVEVRPVQDVRAQDQPVQNAQTPSLLQSLGLRP
jgi:hypothetical protein